MSPPAGSEDEPSTKIAAMGVRVRKWVSMHGLSLNVNPDLSHYSLIVPCGLVGRGVTSMQKVLGAASPTIDRVKGVLVQAMRVRIQEALASAQAKRA